MTINKIHWHEKLIELLTSYDHSAIVNYDSRAVGTRNLSNTYLEIIFLLSLQFFQKSREQMDCPGFEPRATHDSCSAAEC